MHSHHDHDPLQPHGHDPNFEPPSSSPEFLFSRPDGSQTLIDVPYLQSLPMTIVPNCYIVSTGHGTSGPFAFGGVQLRDLIAAQVASPHPTLAWGSKRGAEISWLSWSQVEVISNDGFGNRVTREELANPDPAGPILLAYAIDGTLMNRKEGLVRLIVPSERDDALRQVKWVGQINVR